VSDDSKIVLEVRGYDREQLLHQLAERVLSQVHDDNGRSVDAALREKVAGHIDEMVVSIAQERIRAEVDAVLSEGWQPMSQWGEPQGTRITLRARVAETLTRKGRFGRNDGYNTPETTWVEHVGKELLDAWVRAELSKELESAKVRFREQVDAVLQSKLVDVLRTSLGLGR
jgi:hypothetical protein